MQHKRLRNILTLLLILLFPALLTVNYTYQSFVVEPDSVVVKNGIFTVTDSFSDGKSLGLKGDVEFYWNRLLTPVALAADTAKRDGYLKIPGLWNGTVVNGQTLGGKGYATIRFWLNLAPNRYYGLKLKEFESAYSLWIDGRLRAKCGTVAKTESGMVPCWERRDLYFVSTERPTEVVIQISNFQHWKGGPEDTIILGSARDILNLKSLQEGVGYFIFGIFLVMSLYHLVLFLYRKTDHSALLFSLFCFTIMVRLLTTGEKLILKMLPGIDWVVAVRIEYLSYILSPPLLMHFFQIMYPQFFSKGVLRISYLLAGMFALLVLVAPSTVFTYTPIAYQVIIFISGIYVFYVLFKAAIEKLENSFVLLFSYCFFFILLVNDILFYNRVLDTSFLSPLGVFVMIFSQSMVLSKKTSVAFRDVEVLTDRLQRYNRELESKIEERTHEIRLQKMEIEAQADVLLEVNGQLTRMGHLKNALMAMIVHDLKNPLNMILNYSKDERITSAGKQMHGLVQNILDIQKYDNDKMVLYKRRVAVDKVLSKATFSVNYLAYQKGVRIVNRIPVGLMLEVDEDVLERIFINLLTNALKYSPINSDVILESRLEQDYCRFEVVDCGPGIPEDKISIVFNQYESYDERMLGRIKPSGLGLAFCKMAVEAHDGEIGFTAKDGGGSIFWFKIPAAQVPMLVELLPEVLEQSLPSPPVFDCQEDVDLFRANLNQLLRMQVHEVSRIRKVLNEPTFESNSSYQEWMQSILTSIWGGNDYRYQKILEQATNQIDQMTAFH